MADYTRFHITALPALTNSDEKEMCVMLNEYIDPEIKINELDDMYNDLYAWNNYEEDMKKISVKFPANTFIVECCREYSDERWVHYFDNGSDECCESKIVYDEPKNPIFKGLIIQ